MAKDPVLRKSWDVAMRLLISSLRLVAELILCPQVCSWSQEIKALAAEMGSLPCNTYRELFFSEGPGGNQFLKAGKGPHLGFSERLRVCWAGS